MKAEIMIKQDYILEAAIRRFSHFGVSKTTLTEVAEDLGISKPLLFYYFHDKNSLVTAVAKKIIKELLDGLETGIRAAGSVEEGLFDFVEIKRKYFKRYFLLALQAERADISNVPAGLSEVYRDARERTVIILSMLINKGIAQGVLKSMDAVKVSGVLLDTLSAYEYCYKIRKTIPEVQDIDELFDKQKLVLEMLLNGLRREPGNQDF